MMAKQDTPALHAPTALRVYESYLETLPRASSHHAAYTMRLQAMEAALRAFVQEAGQ